MFARTRRRRSTGVLIAAAAFLSLVVGCAQEPDIKTDSTISPDPTASPIGEEEGFAAAKAAYEAYVEVSDRVYSEGGVDSDRIDDVASGSAASDFKAAASDLSARGLKTTGTTAIDTFTFQSIETGDPMAADVVIYLCSDVSNVDVVDPAGVSQVSPSRLARTPYEVTVTIHPSESAKVSKRTPWQGKEFC